MKNAEFKLQLEYELKSEKALEHHLEVLRLGLDLPSDKFEEFYLQEHETYQKVLDGLLLEFESKLKGIE